LEADVTEITLPRIGTSLGFQLLRLCFSRVVKRIEALQAFLRNHPVVAEQTKFAAWLLAVTAISFCWFVGVPLPG
jgi:hypothetical protein